MQSLQQIVITSIDDAFTVVSPRGRQLHMKNRESFGLSLCESGQITYHHKGKKFVSDAGHALILPQGEDYFLSCEESGKFPVVNFFCTDEFDPGEFLLFQLHSPKSYLKDFERMRNYLLFGKNSSAMGVLYQMLGQIAEENSGDRNLLGIAMDYLEQHYGDPRLCNSMLAEMVGISEVYFRRIFQKTYGVTPKQYILDIRMRRAKQLLTSGYLSISSIAETCGFTSVYHFCRCFKQMTDMTPSDYRKFTERHGV